MEADRGADWYLSVDIKVFQLKAGEKLFGLTAGQGTSPQDGATTWIQQTIDNLNKDPAGLGPVFDNLPPEEDTAALNLLQTDSSGNNIYNFALARVRYQDSQVANNVRLFFRVFATQQVAPTYDPTTSYFSYKSGSTVVPVLGVQGDEIVTIPFFAAPRVDVSQPLSTQPESQEHPHHQSRSARCGGRYLLGVGWTSTNQTTCGFRIGWSETHRPTIVLGRTAASIT